jgi:hypothetical protein
LGYGLHYLPSLLSDDSPVAVAVEDFGYDPEFGHMVEVEILPKSLADCISLEEIAWHIAGTRGTLVPNQSLEATEDEYQSLKASIARHGVKYPIHVDQFGRIIDGRLRKRACDELGISCPMIVVGKTDEAGRSRPRCLWRKFYDCGSRISSRRS